MDESLAINSLLSGSPPSLPLPDRARFELMQAQPGGFAINCVGGSYSSSDGGAGNPGFSYGDATHGPNFEIQVPGGFRTYTGDLFLNTARTIFLEGIYQYRWDAIAADANMYQGMSDAFTTDLIAGNCVAMLVRKNAGIDPPTFQLVTSVAGVVTNRIDTGIPVARNTRYKWQIVVSNGYVTLRVNGRPIATAQGGIPTAIMGLSWELGGFTGLGSTFMIFEYMYGECTDF